jgi:hypothetical protein
MFGNKKKLYAKGAQTEGVVVGTFLYDADMGSFGVRVGVKLPDGSTTEFKTRWPLYPSDVGYLVEGSVVPVRYDPSDHSRVTLDIPVLEASHKQATAARQAQLDAQVAHGGEPGARSQGGRAAQVLAGLAGGDDLKERLVQMAARNTGAVVDLGSSQFPAKEASDPVDRLAKLAELKQQGALSEQEFAAAKAKILVET